jgi:HPt (histidine-containing phosphotransfer) domain-containing protein
MTERELLAPHTSLDATYVLHEFLALNGPEGPELLRAIVETYVAETPPVVAQLGDALACADHTTAAWLAHRLKGRCLGIGARGLAARCAALELACRGANRPSLEAYVGIAADVTATTRTLRAYLARLPK